MLLAERPVISAQTPDNPRIGRMADRQVPLPWRDSMMQDKEMLFEVVPRGDLRRDAQKLGVIGDVAGLHIGLTVRDGKTFLCVRYSDDFCKYKRTRDAGRPRKEEAVKLTCGEAVSLKKKGGAKAAATALGMSVATFYRHCHSNKWKKGEEPFV